MAVEEPTLPVRKKSHELGIKQLRRAMGLSNPLYEFLLPFAYADISFLKDDFAGCEVLNTDLWTVAGTNGTDFAIRSGQAGGHIRATRGNADGDYNAIYSDAQWFGDQRAVFMTRVRPSIATTNKVEVGFTDSSGDTGGAVPVDADLTGAAANTATDCAVLTFDSTTGASWYAATSGTSLTTQWTDTGVDAATATWVKVMITLDQGNIARFYVNDQLVATHLDAVEGGNALLPWVAHFEVGTAGAPTLDCDYIYCYQHRA